MFIKSLRLADYRNYETLSLDFSEGTNIFYGDNAQGKTNILEALYLIATTKSHRGVFDKDLIDRNERAAGVSKRYGNDSRVAGHQGLRIHGEIGNDKG